MIEDMKGRDDSLRIAAGSAVDTAFTAYVPTIELPPVESVLDFGCGLRQFPYLKRIARRVEGFELPEMVERCRTLGPARADSLSSDWREVQARRYDLIFTALVLQHLETERAAGFLADFAAMAPRVYMLTRARSDVGAAILDLVSESRAYDHGSCRIVDLDPAARHLRVVGEASFDAARRSPDDVHYEVLLRSRIF